MSRVHDDISRAFGLRAWALALAVVWMAACDHTTVNVVPIDGGVPDVVASRAIDGPSGDVGDSAAGAGPIVGSGGLRLSSGPQHSCYVDRGGALWCWGNNNRGQLGDGTRTTRPAPVRVGARTDWSSVSASGFCLTAGCGGNTCALRRDGTAWCWGRNGEGQIGEATVNVIASPTQVGTDADWIALTAGPASSCGIRSADRAAGGRLWCWGAAHRWGFNNAIEGLRPTGPEAIGDGTDYVQVGLGLAGLAGLGCALRASGELWCWEESPSPRQTGEVRPARKPARASDATDWIALSAVNGDGLCAVRADGSLWCGRPGGLARVGGEADWRAPSRSASHTCALRADRAWCWGSNGHGELGDGTRTGSGAPRPVDGEGWNAISAGRGFSCGAKGDDSVWCWGANLSGELGVGIAGDKEAPAPVGDQRWLAVAAHHESAAAIRADGSLWSWGMLVDPPDGSLVAAYAQPERVGRESDWRDVDIAWRRRCGVRGDGSLWCWHHEPSPVAPPTLVMEPIGALRDWVAVAVSDDGACALRGANAAARTIHCWGGEHFVPAGRNAGREAPGGEPAQVGAVAGWTQLAVNHTKACAVHGDGTLWCWGGLGRFQDAYVEVDAPVRMGDADDWAAVSTDADFTCGLRRSGALWCGWLKITEPVVAGGTLHADGFERFGGERLFASVTLRNFDVFAIDREGALWSWSFATKDDPPTPVGPGRRWSSVSFDWLGPGRSHHCAIDANRALWCWGDNGVGQLGDGSAWRVRPERIVLP